MKVHAIVERNSRGFYSIFAKESFPHFILLGYGKSLQEAKKDFWAFYNEMKEMYEDTPEIEVVFLTYLCGKKDRRKKPIMKGLRLHQL